jgi:hypothetical protein
MLKTLEEKQYTCLIEFKNIFLFLEIIDFQNTSKTKLKEKEESLLHQKQQETDVLNKKNEILDKGSFLFQRFFRISVGVNMVRK